MIDDSSILKTLDKSLLVLEYMAKKKCELGVRELSTILKINKSTTFRILNTLVTHRFVIKNQENSKYRLGFACLELSNSALQSTNIRDSAHNFLIELRNSTTETVNLVILDEGMGVYIDRIESVHRIRMVSSIGTREVLHCTGVGKALLAYLPELELDNIINKHGLEKKTKNTITDKDELKKHLNLIKAQGYSIDDEEGEEGIKCVGAPIFDNDGKVIASISVSLPSYRWNSELADKFAYEVKETAKNISNSLRGVFN